MSSFIARIIGLYRGVVVYEGGFRVRVLVTRACIIIFRPYDYRLSCSYWRSFLCLACALLAKILTRYEELFAILLARNIPTVDLRSVQNHIGKVDDWGKGPENTNDWFGRRGQTSTCTPQNKFLPLASG